MVNVGQFGPWASAGSHLGAEPMTRNLIIAVALITSGLIFTDPALAQTVIINQAKAMSGNVTPGDDPGFPVTLSLPGSYRLSSNLSPGPDLDGIVVAVPDITIDFNDFILAGGRIGETSNSWNGIVDQSDRLTVKNGTIVAFERNGIAASGRVKLIVENMRIINNSYGTYNPSGIITRIQNSTVSRNGNVGIHCGSSCHVEGNIVSSNGLFGIQIQTGTILGNTIVSNGGVGIGVEYFPNKQTTAGFGNNTPTENNRGGEQVAALVMRTYSRFFRMLALQPPVERLSLGSQGDLRPYRRQSPP